MDSDKNEGAKRTILRKDPDRIRSEEETSAAEYIAITFKNEPRQEPQN